jgi:hypothetical protein
MGGNAPELIVTGKNANMKAVVIDVFPNSIHRLCMWHIIKILPNKIGPHLLEDRFWEEVNPIVYGVQK